STSAQRRDMFKTTGSPLGTVAKNQNDRSDAGESRMDTNLGRTIRAQCCYLCSKFTTNYPVVPTIDRSAFLDRVRTDNEHQRLTMAGIRYSWNQVFICTSHVDSIEENKEAKERENQEDTVEEDAKGFFSTQSKELQMCGICYCKTRKWSELPLSRDTRYTMFAVVAV
ncbi:hypothetical protein PENTCL1PPCAC_19859, partial [Pristionchus entomophagus]